VLRCPELLRAGFGRLEEDIVCGTAAIELS
jgi:hypothetical protein